MPPHMAASDCTISMEFMNRDILQQGQGYYRADHSGTYITETGGTRF